MHTTFKVTTVNDIADGVSFNRLELASQAYQDAVARVKAAELDLRGLRLNRKKAGVEYDAAAALSYPATPGTSAR